MGESQAWAFNLLGTMTIQGNKYDFGVAQEAAPVGLWGSLIHTRHFEDKDQILKLCVFNGKLGRG